LNRSAQAGNGCGNKMETIMSILTLPAAAVPQRAPGQQSWSSRGWWRRLLAARKTQARGHLVAYLAHQSDERLAALGFAADAIEAVRQGRWQPSLPA
jgi:hypothetical protein